LERAAGTLGFSQVERSLRAFATALWGRAPLLRAIEPVEGRPLPRRVSIGDGVIGVPQVFRSVSGDTAAELFRACIAHATAHLALTPARFPIGQLIRRTRTRRVHYWCPAMPLDSLVDKPLGILPIQSERNML
jgi:nitric oxide reductase NorD protein